MDLNEAETLARDLISEWLHPVWTFRWNNSVRNHGECQALGPGDQPVYQIRLSRRLTAINPREVVEDTIRHEIAHALTITERQAHGPEWQANAVRVGAIPEASAMKAQPAVAVKVPPKWTATCPGCEHVTARHRLSRSERAGDTACQSCCRRHNHGEWDERFRLTFTRTET